MAKPLSISSSFSSFFNKQELYYDKHVYLYIYIFILLIYKNIFKEKKNCY